MKTEEFKNSNAVKKWYQNVWVITGLFLACFVALGLVLFVVKTYGFYKDIKAGRANDSEFMAIAQPTEQMRMQEILKERQREQNKVKVQGREGDPFFGPENAEKEIVVFIDYGCPYCKMA
ncbi:hypothetical protein GF391_00265, partial [Candidatus Uhrbacteria bacterium]|nr:hypothetical protein [Candidatus Uhrbacteria bacterium]